MKKIQHVALGPDLLNTVHFLIFKWNTWFLLEKCCLKYSLKKEGVVAQADAEHTTHLFLTEECKAPITECDLEATQHCVRLFCQ